MNRFYQAISSSTHFTPCSLCGLQPFSKLRARFRHLTSTRADRAVKRVRAVEGDVLLFSSAHFLRVFAARWLGLEPGAGRFFLLSTASLSALGYEHNVSEPVIRLWDDTRHVGT